MPQGSLTFIGLGLYDEKDISLKGLDHLRESEIVFSEFYTARLMGTTFNKMEKFFGKKIRFLNRAETERADIILKKAKTKKVSFLVCGDSMSATTHVDLRIRAVNLGIKTRVIHGNSIVTAVPGLLGLQNYKFGRTTTLVYPENNFFPVSPYEVIKSNKNNGLHTLVLLDYQADVDRFMTANSAIEILLKIESKMKKKIITKNSLICVVARAGSKNPLVIADKICELKKMDFGSPFHSLVVPGSLHFMEIEALHKLASLPDYMAEKLQKI
jgi:diphthine synthase